MMEDNLTVHGLSRTASPSTCTGMVRVVVILAS